MTTIDTSKRTWRISLRETSCEKCRHTEWCNAESVDEATAYAKTKLESSGLALEDVWEIDPNTGKRI